MSLPSMNNLVAQVGEYVGDDRVLSVYERLARRKMYANLVQTAAFEQRYVELLNALRHSRASLLQSLGSLSSDLTTAALAST